MWEIPRKRKAISRNEIVPTEEHIAVVCIHQRLALDNWHWCRPSSSSAAFISRETNRHTALAWRHGRLRRGDGPSIRSNRAEVYV